MPLQRNKTRRAQTVFLLFGSILVVCSVDVELTFSHSIHSFWPKLLPKHRQVKDETGAG